MKTNDRLERVRRCYYLVWSIIGIALIVVACGYVLGQVWTSISIMLFSAFLVFIMRAPVALLERHRVPRVWGTAISYVGMLVIVALILLIFIPIIGEQAVGLISLIPGYISSSQDYWTGIYQQYGYLLEDNKIQQVIGSATTDLSRWAASFASESAGNMLAWGTGIINGFMVVFVSMVVGFWVLKDLPRIGQELRILIGPRHEEDLLFISDTCSRALGGYLKSMLVAGTCTGMMAGICYHFIGLPYPVVLGLLTGLMNFIPFVGPWIAGVIVALVGLFVSPLAALLAIIATIVPQSITDNFITPRVMAHAVELHPSVILIVLFAGGALGGILGMICAIPVTAAAKSIFVYYFEKRTGRQLISLKGALFKGKPPASPDDAPDDDPDAADAPTSTPAPPASPDDDPAVPTSLPAPTDPI